MRGNPHYTIISILVWGLGIYLACIIPINSDSGWLLWVAQRMLDGAVYGRDIVELNPPLSAYIHFPPVLIAHTLGISVYPVFIAYTLAVIGVSVLLCQRILRYSPLEKADKRLILVTLTGALLFVCHADIHLPLLSLKFGQREHFIIAFLLPYIFLCWLRIENRETPLLRRIICGMLMGLAVCLKPHYALVPLLLEGYCCYKQRRWGAWFNPTTIASGFVAIFYGIVLWQYNPDYWPILRLTVDAYGPFGYGILAKLIFFIPLLPFLLFFGVLWCYRKTHSPLHSLFPIIGLALFAAQCAGVAQNKGYPYHFLPFSILTVLLGAMSLRAFVPNERLRFCLKDPAKNNGFTAVFIALLLMGLCIIAPLGTGNFSSASQSIPVQTYLEKLSPRPQNAAVLAVEHTFYFPNTSGIYFTPRFLGLWLLGAEVTSLPPKRKAEIRAYLLNSLAEDFQKQPPEVVFAYPPDLAKLINTPNAFQAIWQRYQKTDTLVIAPNYTLDVYTLKP